MVKEDCSRRIGKACAVLRKVKEMCAGSTPNIISLTGIIDEAQEKVAVDRGITKGAVNNACTEEIGLSIIDFRTAVYVWLCGDPSMLRKPLEDHAVDRKLKADFDMIKSTL